MFLSTTTVDIVKVDRVEFLWATSISVHLLSMEQRCHKNMRALISPVNINVIFWKARNRTCRETS
jgi:hypothetical protein